MKIKNRKGFCKVTLPVQYSATNIEYLATAYILYDTRIVLFTHNCIILDSGGFHTNHTKNCMNDVLPDGYRVYQKKHTWYVDTPEGVREFKDGMIINYSQGQLNETSI